MSNEQYVVSYLDEVKHTTVELARFNFLNNAVEFANRSKQQLHSGMIYITKSGYIYKSVKTG